MILLSNTGIELAKYRRRHPGDDLMTSIVNVEVDGHRLTDEEVGAFLILLAAAGNDTIKQTTSHAMMALAENPAQRDWLMEDFEGRIGLATDEFVRWASPVLQFARFATEDLEIGGQQIKAGDARVPTAEYCPRRRARRAACRSSSRCRPVRSSSRHGCRSSRLAERERHARRGRCSETSTS
jgi:cytochrome P450